MWVAVRRCVWAQYVKRHDDLLALPVTGISDLRSSRRILKDFYGKRFECDLWIIEYLVNQFAVYMGINF